VSRYFTEFQSHDPEFDHLKSLEVNERINSLAFLQPQSYESVRLLSTNEREIKLFEIKEYSKRQYTPS
jgi:serine/threonine-protein phosphatase 2A regulatory subunit B